MNDCIIGEHSGAHFIDLLTKCISTYIICRLSKLTSEKLTSSNPNVTDLADPDRPTKLGEVSSELYDNEWTDAFEALLSGGRNERFSIRILLETFLVQYIGLYLFIYLYSHMFHFIYLFIYLFVYMFHYYTPHSNCVCVCVCAGVAWLVVRVFEGVGRGVGGAGVVITLQNMGYLISIAYCHFLFIYVRCCLNTWAVT